MSAYSHNTVPTRFAEANGIRFAYRRFGRPGRTPVVFTQHFMGNLDDHDPAVTDALAADREVILFDNTGVGATDGDVPDSIERMAADAEAFLGALGLDRVDLVGHSMGGLVVQELAINRPDLVRRVVLVGTAPRGGDGVGELPDEVAALFGKQYPRQEDMWLPILFSPSEPSQRAGRAYVDRIVARPDRDDAVSAQSITAQLTAIHAYGADKDAAFAGLKKLAQPTLVVNGGTDIIIATVNSYLLQQHLPDAQLILYPDAGHGAHHQYPDLFVAHVRLFLDATPEVHHV